MAEEDGGYECICNEGYTGENCAERICKCRNFLEVFVFLFPA